MTDLTGRTVLPIDFTREGRVAVMYYLTVHLLGGRRELDRVVLDTGLEVAALIPKALMGELLLGEDQRQASVKSLTNHRIDCVALNVTIQLGDMREDHEIYVGGEHEEAIIGLPLLKRFHLLLAPDHEAFGVGSCLVKPPLAAHGLRRGAGPNA